MATLSTLLVKLGLDDKRFQSGVKRAVKGLNGLVDQAGKLSTVGKAAGLATLAASAIALSSAVVPAAGALLALPAAAGLAGAAFATLKVATVGVGDAFEAVASGDAAKLEEALKKLAPSARKFVKSWQGIREQFKPVQQAVQQQLFAGLGRQMRSVAGKAMPTLKSGMTGVADAFNDLGKNVLRVMGTPLFRGQLAKVFKGAEGATRTFGGVLPPLITVLMQLAALALPLVSRFNEWAAGALKSAAAFLTSERGTAKLNAMLQRGIAVMGQLIRIAKNLGLALGGIFGAAFQEGTSLLTTIEQLTAKFAAWVKSAEGQQQLKETFALLGQVARDLLTILPGIAVVIGTIAGWFTSLPAPVQSVVTQFLAWSIVLGGIAGKLGGLVSALATVGPALLKGAKAVALFGGKLIWLGIQALLTGARMALAWIIGLGPIGIIIAVVIALVALIILNWDKVKAVTIKIFKAVWGFLKRVWSNIVSAVQGAVDRVLSIVAWFGRLPSRVAAWFARVKTAATQKLSALVNWVRGIPRRILSALGNLGRLLWNAGRSVIEGLINGIKSAFSWLQDTLGWVTSIIPSWKGPLSTDRTLLTGAGQAIMGGLIDGIMSQRRALHRELTGVGTDVAALMDRAAANLALPDANLGLAGGISTPAGARAARGGAAVIEIKGDDSRTSRFLVGLLRESVRGKGGDVQTLQGRR